MKEIIMHYRDQLASLKKQLKKKDFFFLLIFKYHSFLFDHVRCWPVESAEGCPLQSTFCPSPSYNFVKANLYSSVTILPRFLLRGNTENI